ncbi:MAG: hypothetical protein GF333_03530 [Candidatus Omnitrophica bacterium]|nr:hypothetical protein [Candidatus Omnitrophota bacterium]
MRARGEDRDRKKRGKPFEAKRQKGARMRVDVSLKYLDRSEFIDNVIEKNIKKISRRLRMFRRDDPIHISLHLEKHPLREQYFCRAHVYLPAKLLNADEKGRTFPVAVNKSFAALVKQLDKHKEKVETHVRKKKGTRRRTARAQ